jgi:hypothetical protein
MDAETAARLSAWPALLCYAAALALWMLPRNSRRDVLIRGIWAAGWLSLVLHIGIAMWLVHDGSWDAAYDHTARRTQAATGWNWGGGVWFNLLTASVWGIHVFWTWIRAKAISRRTSLVDWVCQIYLAFMMFNATVVFGTRPAQIAGGLICVGLAIIAVRTRRPTRY